MNSQTENSLKIYSVAKANLGNDLCGNTDPELGCMVTANAISGIATGKQIGGGSSTELGYVALQDTTRYTLVALANALPGDWIIAATGKGTNPRIPHGHIGVVAVYGIVSNASDTGTVQEKWTIPTFTQYYGVEGGYPIECYRTL